ncbi:MAG: YeeE/YedE family protein, partial [Proteobacteria bacterium]|nr:YeeE/YedE family protein [Pseudomonadota bacterium]
MSYMFMSALLGLGGGIVLGLAARMGEFCTFGAIESAYMGHDQRRLRLWGIVLGVAIICVFTLDSLGQLDISQTLYHRVQWNPVASIVGGLIFGYGMALSGNCGFGALARFGGGDLRALVVVIVIAVSGFFTLNGPLAPLRVILFPTIDTTEPQGFAHLLSDITGAPPIVFAALIATALIIWALRYAPLRQRKADIIWGIAAGLAITSAFWGTSALREASFEEIVMRGHTFTAPLGAALLYLMTSSGAGFGFATGSVLGV